MSTLSEVKIAAESLPREQQTELMRFLESRLFPGELPTRGARLVDGPQGTRLLEAPPDAPPMTTDRVKQMLEDFP
jgi:hypothetical protein